MDRCACKWRPALDGGYFAVALKQSHPTVRNYTEKFVRISRMPKLYPRLLTNRIVDFRGRLAPLDRQDPVSNLLKTREDDASSKPSSPHCL